MMKLFYGILLIIVVSSCSPFDTRNPEEPENNSSSYVPPTSPEIVIENFKNAILEKNLDNYMNCFTGSTPSSNIKYDFVPSPDVLNSFPNIFQNWTLEDERRIFTAMISNLPQNLSIDLNIENDQKGFESRTPDSALYVSYYSIRIPAEGTYTTYEGNLQFNIISMGNSFWRINKWVDSDAGSDTTETWSFLKGKLY